MGDNKKASGDKKDERSRTPMVQTGFWRWTTVAGMGMWGRMFWIGTGMCPGADSTLDIVRQART